MAQLWTFHSYSFRHRYKQVMVYAQYCCHLLNTKAEENTGIAVLLCYKYEYIYINIKTQIFRKFTPYPVLIPLQGTYCSFHFLCDTDNLSGFPSPERTDMYCILQLCVFQSDTGRME